MAYAVITGASKGIGKCIAVELASRGYDLLLIARSEAELKAVSQELESRFNVKAPFLMLDLSQPGSAKKIFDKCYSEALPVSILVNNAGYGLAGSFMSYEAGDHLAMMKVNIDVPVELTHLFLDTLKKSPQSYILNIASSAAYQAVPGLSVYAASKAFLLSFTRALRQELKSSNVSVTCICPGTTDTNFNDRANLNDKARQMAKRVTMTSEKVAKIAVSGMFSGKAEVIPGFINKLGAVLVKILPNEMVEKTAMKIYGP
ncbi:SDR family NAD(P)-dependent oxidoreductase [Flavihumibacter profundi]|jgi:uncharacterized protein|uniref:SDR family NAD(P)-dependent oxidoreductase n=1 Tax=Flavihumibacter profundi TaxID=2716883 RepID=UPI001CC4FBB8|nr:SDR family oxidoreductase [Flavihumibacter profundi]MBZ5859364.1 SDR family oxidoreductase [Flavihumibacter profundi]